MENPHTIVFRNNPRKIMPLCRLELSLAHATEIIDRLKEKKTEYITRIKGPSNKWDSSWKHTDLVMRHDDDADFRLIYYKLVIISTFIIAYEKNMVLIKNKAGDTEKTVDTWFIGSDLARSLDRQLHPDEFNLACHVINGYIDGTRALS